MCYVGYLSRLEYLVTLCVKLAFRNAAVNGGGDADTAKSDPVTPLKVKQINLVKKVDDLDFCAIINSKVKTSYQFLQRKHESSSSSSEDEEHSVPATPATPSESNEGKEKSKKKKKKKDKHKGKVSEEETEPQAEETREVSYISEEFLFSWKSHHLL